MRLLYSRITGSCDGGLFGATMSYYHHFTSHIWSAAMVVSHYERLLRLEPASPRDLLLFSDGISR